MKTRMTTKIKRHHDIVFNRRIVTVGVFISCIMVAVSLFVAIFFSPEAVAKRKFEFLATEYYETYYYPKFIEAMDESVFADKMEIFSTTGLQPVPLRQLLLYQNAKNSSYKKYFDNSEYSCDKNKTQAKFYPVSPYGATDYTVEYTYVCEEV